MGVQNACFADSFRDLAVLESIIMEVGFQIISLIKIAIFKNCFKQEPLQENICLDLRGFKIFVHKDLKVEVLYSNISNTSFHQLSVSLQP